MAPPFHSTRHAMAFSGVLLFFLTLPVTLHGIGGVSQEQAFRGISERAGNFNLIHHEIFEKNSDLDVFFCGSSLLNAAIDPSLVAQEMSKATGHSVKTLLLLQSWQGPDMNYFIARTMMEHRKVKMLVIAAPASIHRSDQPHVQLFRVIRYGDFPGALDGLGVRSRLAVYGDYVLGAPRQALSLLRPNRVEAGVGLAKPEPFRIGYQGGPWVSHEVAGPAVPSAESVDSVKSEDLFHFDGPALSDYQLYFLKKTAELARKHGALLVILHLPSPSERGQAIVPDRKRLPGVFGNRVAFVGVPSARLFRGIPDSNFFDYYQDEHVNWNGTQLYTEAITPALTELYERYFQAH